MRAEDAAEAAMQRAVVLGHSVRRRAAPNPWVGCLLLRDGVVVGEGATAAPGGPHAEIAAVRAAGGAARGATAVVTLEPCSHHGRTGPCAQALVEAGVARVVAALGDPDPRVGGRGFEMLRRAGVEVLVGVGADEAAVSLAPYLHHRRTGRSFALMKVATSLDGRVAAADGTSRWITGAPARADAHGLRADSQAVVVGSGTARVDRPRLTVRDAAPPVGPPPLRVLLDASGRVPAAGPLFDVAEAPTLVLTSERAPQPAVAAWREAGAEVEVIGRADGPTRGTGGAGVDLAAVLATLGARGVLQALFEGGGQVHGSLLAAGLADHVVVYLAPLALGERAPSGYATAGPATLAEAPRMRLVGVTRLGDDVRLDYTTRGGD